MADATEWETRWRKEHCDLFPYIWQLITGELIGAWQLHLRAGECDHTKSDSNSCLQVLPSPHQATSKLVSQASPLAGNPGARQPAVQHTKSRSARGGPSGAPAAPSLVPRGVPSCRVAFSRLAPGHSPSSPPSPPTCPSLDRRRHAGILPCWYAAQILRAHGWGRGRSLAGIDKLDDAVSLYIARFSGLHRADGTIDTSNKAPATSSHGQALGSS